ncbi:hypothetical protein Tco_0795290 [Tanacetum coccineum]
MLRRSQPSGAQNRKRKQKEQESNKAQFGSLEPFVVRQKKNNNNGEENIESNENPTNNENPISDNANVNENDDVDVNKNDEVDVNENDDANLNENDDLDVNENDDVIVWDGLRSHMKDELVSKWPIRETNLDYPKDKIGTNDWKHLSTALKKHENSSEHMINFRTWSELRIRLSTNQTIEYEWLFIWGEAIGGKNINNISTFQKQEHRHIHSFISHTQSSKIHFRNSDKSKNFLKSSSC